VTKYGDNRGRPCVYSKYYRLIRSFLKILNIINYKKNIIDIYKVFSILNHKIFQKHWDIILLNKYNRFKLLSFFNFINMYKYDLERLLKISKVVITFIRVAICDSNQVMVLTNNFKNFHFIFIENYYINI